MQESCQCRLMDLPSLGNASACLDSLGELPAKATTGRSQSLKTTLQAWSGLRDSPANKGRRIGFARAAVESPV